MKVDRRRALAWAGAGLGAAGASGCATADGAEGSAVTFSHGVASGDPLSDRAVIWTRVSGGADEVSVIWAVFADAAMTQRVKTGVLRTSVARDFTIKVDVSGLQPGTEHHYRFNVGDIVSPVGRFRTLPERAEDVVLAVVSCSLHPGGLFNAYDAVARLPRVDAVVHLGDYIYEYGAGDADYGVTIGKTLGRLPEPPKEIVTLDDYRRRHAQYKSDPDLQAAHARAAWIVAWDDHESANDTWLGGAENHDPDQGEGEFATRKAAALKAYYEWMPIREPGRGRSAEMADRTFRFADVATLHMVETRLLARTKQLAYDTDLPMTGGRPDLPAFRAKLNAPDRNLLGGTQLGTLAASVEASVKAGVTWQVLGNQVVMGRVRGPDLVAVAGQPAVTALLATLSPSIRPRLERMAQLFVNDVPFNLDAWDGYPAERERLYGMLTRAGAHPIVLAGDSHAFWVNDLKDATGRRVAAEFGTTSVTSPGFGDVVGGFNLGAVIAAQNDEVVFSDQKSKGFTLLTLTRSEARAELRAVSTILTKPYASFTVGTYRVTPAEGAGVSAVAKV